MIYLGITFAILIIDLGIKHYVEHGKTKQQDHEILSHKIIIRKSHNKGIALNALDQHTTLVKVLSAGMTLIMGVVALRALVKKDTSFAAAGKKLGLSWILGGALSNTYDRIFRGYVVDYFSFNVKWKKLRNIVFNLADMFIIIGSVIYSCFGQSDGTSNTSSTLKKSIDKTSA